MAVQEAMDLSVATRTLSLAGAELVLKAALREAVNNGWRVSIAVVDATGLLLAFARIDEARRLSGDLAIGKARTSATSGVPSGVIQQRIDGGEVSLLGLQGLTPAQGGVPILINGQVVGGVGASGVAPSDDERIAVAGARACA